MENPEEVLQALDEFQKRPFEIPRELEDYLCWVARTGDPVYQWSLIKALFREKLDRVITEFYESCPTLDLTPCPNVEQFNYDIMKSNLIERLESFTNAPFTVQRICELLTTPKKEYYRIDKFMRAIEKNILVVSTREPGPYGRRSENGDSMVNGSIEDETSHHGHTSNEVEMENWVKDCTATTAVAAHTDDTDEMSVENGVKTTLNTTFEKHEREEPEQSIIEPTPGSFITSSADFNPVTNMPVQATPVHEATSVVQNLTTITHEATGIVGDVSDAIMNEDTSSQPSLELENDSNDSNDSKKLQTTFQAKDFTIEEEKTVKTYSEALKTGKPEESIGNIDSSRECDQLIQATYSSEKVLNENSSDSQNSDKPDSVDADTNIVETNKSKVNLSSEPLINENCETESNVSLDNFSIVNSNLDVNNDESGDSVVVGESNKPLVEIKIDTEVKDETKTESVEKESDVNVTDSSENPAKETSENLESAGLNEITKPIIEEPLIEVTNSNSPEKLESSKLTIEETTENAAQTTKTIVPDPIPIIEEPKDGESTTKDWSSSVLVTEVANEPKDPVTAIKNGLIESPVKSDQAEENQMIVTGCEEAPSKGPSESMDVDNEEISDGEVPQDEPMEQELTEAMNS